jgi:hypothetical protein
MVPVLYNTSVHISEQKYCTADSCMQYLAAHPLSRIRYYAHTQGMRLSLGMLHSIYLCMPIRADLIFMIYVLVGTTANFGAKAIKKDFHDQGLLQSWR